MPPADTPTADPARTASLADAWATLDADERAEAFESLSHLDAPDFFMSLPAADQASLLSRLPVQERRLWFRMLAPDDAADLIQHSPPEEHGALLDLLDHRTRTEVHALLTYADEVAGGRMNPRYASLRPEMRVDEALSYLRLQAAPHETLIYYGYVLDAEQHLLGVISFRELFTARSSQLVRDVMRTDLVTVPEELDQEEVAQLIASHDLLAVPVVDAEGRIKGIVTADDIFDVVRQEATEDIHKFGGIESLDLPYFRTRMLTMVRKRAGWLTVLFLGGILTASVMSVFTSEIEEALVLTLFVPMIISSGGNSGSQASTLIIRAMALDEIRLRDWWLVARRELVAGLILGAILAIVGVIRIVAWEAFFESYGGDSLELAATVSVSLLAVVTWGSMAGSMLPFLLMRFRLDPATASAPFVATLSDVAGIVIYFTVARIFLLGG